VVFYVTRLEVSDDMVPMDEIALGEAVRFLIRLERDQPLSQGLQTA
jgi:hypothetical protein